MKKIINPMYVLSACLAVCCRTAAFGQDAGQPEKDGQAGSHKVDDAAMMAKMMELAQPGSNHKTLERLVGHWSYKVKFWMDPTNTNMPPMESTGTTVTKAAMDGRYFISEHKGQMQMPGPGGAMQDVAFNGMGIEGFDNVKGKFVASWIDNMGTGIMNMEGTFDPASDTLTYIADYEPMPGMKTKIRQTVTITDNDHHTLAFFETRGSKEVKTMEIAYTRAHAGD